jgi:hypothetical protein
MLMLQMEIAQMPRTVIATIKPSPTITATTGSVCISGTATLEISLRRNNQLV